MGWDWRSPGPGHDDEVSLEGLEGGVVGGHGVPDHLQEYLRDGPHLGGRRAAPPGEGGGC